MPRSYSITLATSTALAALLGSFMVPVSAHANCSASSGTLASPGFGSTVTCTSSYQLPSRIGDGSAAFTLNVLDGVELDTVNVVNSEAIRSDVGTITLGDGARIFSSGTRVDDAIYVDGGGTVTLGDNASIEAGNTGIFGNWSTTVDMGQNASIISDDAGIDIAENLDLTMADGAEVGAVDQAIKSNNTLTATLTNATVSSSGLTVSTYAAMEASLGFDVTLNSTNVTGTNGRGFSANFGSGTFVMNGTSTIEATNEGMFAADFANGDFELTLNDTAIVRSLTDSAIEAENGFILDQSAGTRIEGSLIGIQADSTDSHSTIDSAGYIGGSNYAIKLGTNDDSITLRTGADISGDIDMGGGNDNLTLQGNGSLTGAVSNATVWDIQANSTGWQFSDNATYNDFDITSGLFVNNGTLTAAGTTPNFLIGASTTYGGTGTTVGDVDNFGTLAPGNSIGRLTITGDYAQDSSATLDIEVDTDASADVLDVSGTATLAGTLNFTPLGGTAFNLTDGTSFTFLEAGTITGAFDTITDLFPDFDFDISQVGQTLIATVTGNELEYEDKATSQSESKSAKAFEDRLSGASGTQATTVANALSSPSKAPKVLASQSNVLTNASVGTAQGAVGQVVQVVRSRMNAGTGQAVGSQPGPSLVQSSLSSQGSAYAQDAGHDALLNLKAKRDRHSILGDSGGLWVQAVGGLGEVDTDRYGLGSTFATYGFAIGAEKTANADDSKVGAFVGYTESKTKVKTIGDESQIGNYQLGIYGSHAPANNWNLSGALSTSYLDFTTERPTVTGIAGANFGGVAAFASGEISYEMPTDYHISLTPYALVEGSLVRRNAYQEEGAGILNNNVTSHTSRFLNSVLGMRFAKEWDIGQQEKLANGQTAGWRLNADTSLGWAHQYGDTNVVTNATFQGSNVAFESEGPRRNRDSMRIGFNASLENTAQKNILGFIRYEGDMASNAQEHIIRVGFAWLF